VVAATTSPPTTKARSSTRTATALTTPISVVGGLCFNVCFSQLEPKPLFVLSARFMLLGSFFTWVYFLLESFFSPSGGGDKKLGRYTRNSVAYYSTIQPSSRLYWRWSSTGNSGANPPRACADLTTNTPHSSHTR
jgi:hypothetical protein